MVSRSASDIVLWDIAEHSLHFSPFPATIPRLFKSIFPRRDAGPNDAPPMELL